MFARASVPTKSSVAILHRWCKEHWILTLLLLDQAWVACGRRFALSLSEVFGRHPYGPTACVIGKETTYDRFGDPDGLSSRRASQPEALHS